MHTHLEMHSQNSEVGYIVCTEYQAGRHAVSKINCYRYGVPTAAILVHRDGTRALCITRFMSFVHFKCHLLAQLLLCMGYSVCGTK
jgi:hypothetical protein